MSELPHPEFYSYDVRIDLDKCNGCQKCYKEYPKHFKDRGDGKGVCHTLPKNDDERGNCLKAAQKCPVSAIEVQS